MLHVLLLDPVYLWRPGKIFRVHDHPNDFRGACFGRIGMLCRSRPLHVLLVLPAPARASCTSCLVGVHGSGDVAVVDRAFELEL